MNCIQPERAGGGDVEVAAVVGLDLVDRGQDLPADAVLHAGGLVDREQERRDPELVDEEVRDADRRRPGSRASSSGSVGRGRRRGRERRRLDLDDFVLIVTIGFLFLQSRPEVEVEHFSILTTLSSVLDFLVGDLRVTPFDGPAAARLGSLPAVTVPVASGAGEAVAVCSGEAAGRLGGRRLRGGLDRGLRGRLRGVWTGAVASGAALSSGAGAITVGVLSGELVATGSWAGEAAPRIGGEDRGGGERDDDDTAHHRLAGAGGRRTRLFACTGRGAGGV